ncbi:MAG: hypothetical protein HPY52_10720 [Firmicutes bacterium]|nr:hypothetical protein [Bacillota bacterium]
MKIPDKVKIGPFVYIIERPEIVDRYERELIGQCDHQAGIIRIERALTGSKAEETLLHEILHAVTMFMCLDLSEKQISQLSNGLYMVLKENNLLAGGDEDGEDKAK